MKTADQQSSVLVTGGNGYLGREVIKRLHADKDNYLNIVAFDIRSLQENERLPGVKYITGDIRSPQISEIMGSNEISIVVHLASIVTPGKKSSREFEYSVDVLGTKNILENCIKMGVRKIIVTSSGAAYGYHADNPSPLWEDDPLRGNQEFAYSDHKRQVEEILKEYRQKHPMLKQLIFRPGTILGATTSNQITKLFERKYILGLHGSDTPFVFIWDQDVVECIVIGISEDRTGIYNLAGDGVLALREIAKRLKKPVINLPVSLVRYALGIFHSVGLSQYGPEQVDFLRYRPVLSNEKLKSEFGYVPKLNTGQVFDYYLTQKLKPGK